MRLGEQQERHAQNTVLHRAGPRRPQRRVHAGNACGGLASVGPSTPTATFQGGIRMPPQTASSHAAAEISRRALLQRGLTAGLAVAAVPLARPATLWGADAVPPKRGGILRVRG